MPAVLPAIHSKTAHGSLGFNPLILFVAPSARPQRPLVYGEDLWLSIPMSASGTRWLGPGADNTVAEFVLNVPNSSSTAWRLEDPTGEHKSGDRVAVGDRVALRQVVIGKYLSADPAKLQIQLATHSAGWEHWVITPWQP